MKRRFIAGAVCPKCRALDRIVMETDGAKGRRSCVECDFSEDLDEASGSGANTGSSLPASRLLRPQGDADIEPSPVRLIDPKRIPDDS